MVVERTKKHKTIKESNVTFVDDFLALISTLARHVALPGPSLGPPWAPGPLGPGPWAQGPHKLQQLKKPIQQLKI